MMIDIIDGWHVAYHLIHTAFDELAMAERTSHRAMEFAPKELHWAKCLAASGTVGAHGQAVFRHLIKATTLFQAGMEALIYWAYSLPALQGRKMPDTFAKRWRQALVNLGSSHDFGPYQAFYKNVRIAIVHPDTDERLETLRRLEYREVHAGIQAGWDAFEALSSVCGRPHTPNSWVTICGVHGVAADLAAHPVPSLRLVERDLAKKHLDGARAAAELTNNDGRQDDTGKDEA